MKCTCHCAHVLPMHPMSYFCSELSISLTFYQRILWVFCSELSISTLCARDQICLKYFCKLFDPASWLHHLILDRRDNEQILKLRNLAVYQSPFARTERFKKSFIIYSLNNYLNGYLFFFHLVLSFLCILYFQLRVIVISDCNLFIYPVTVVTAIHNNRMRMSDVM